ncbi:MAG: GNAT family N-acetyltransferase [Candidatus Spyradocola sp.]|jgi:ribosomal-protein-alanine N-acetyltransferase
MKRLEGESIVVRDLAPQDAAGFAALCADPALQRVLTEWEEPVPGDALPTLEDLIAQAQAAADWRAPRRLAIARWDTDEIIGLLGVGEHPDLFEIELVYGLLDACRGRGFTKEAVTLLSDACLRCEGVPYLILTAPDGDGPAFRVAEKCGFHLYERRARVGRRLTNMPGEAYAYFRKY